MYLLNVKTLIIKNMNLSLKKSQKTLILALQVYL